MNPLTYLCGGTQRRFERLLCRCYHTAGGQRYNTFRCWRFWMALVLVWGLWVLRLELQGNRAGWGGEKWRTNSTWVRTGWEKRGKDCQSRRSCKGSGMKSKSFWELCFLLNRKHLLKLSDRCIAATGRHKWVSSYWSFKSQRNITAAKLIIRN